MHDIVGEAMVEKARLLVLTLFTWSPRRLPVVRVLHAGVFRMSPLEKGQVFQNVSAHRSTGSRCTSTTNQLRLNAYAS